MKRYQIITTLTTFDGSHWHRDVLDAPEDIRELSDDVTVDDAWLENETSGCWDWVTDDMDPYERPDDDDDCIYGYEMYQLEHDGDRWWEAEEPCATATRSLVDLWEKRYSQWEQLFCREEN